MKAAQVSISAASTTGPALYLMQVTTLIGVSVLTLWVIHRVG
jgi:hypothetical protein